MTRIANIAWLD